MTFAVQRDGKALTVRASLAPRLTELGGAKLDARLSGARLGVLPERLRRQGVNGVLVLEVDEGSRAFANGLRSGDLVIGINRREVSDLAALERALSSRPAQLLLTLVRGQRSYFAVME